jgi:hypothetical protein
LREFVVCGSHVSPCFFHEPLAIVCGKTRARWPPHPTKNGRFALEQEHTLFKSIFGLLVALASITVFAQNISIATGGTGGV